MALCCRSSFGLVLRRVQLRKSAMVPVRRAPPRSGSRALNLWTRELFRSTFCVVFSPIGRKQFKTPSKLCKYFGVSAAPSCSGHAATIANAKARPRVLRRLLLAAYRVFLGAVNCSCLKAQQERQRHQQQRHKRYTHPGAAATEGSFRRAQPLRGIHPEAGRRREPGVWHGGVR